MTAAQELREYPRAVGLVPAGTGFEDLTLNEWLQERRPGGARYRKVLALVRLPAGRGGGFETRACYGEYLPSPRGAGASRVAAKPSAATAGTKTLVCFVAQLD